jgi:hypothetical protein
MAVHKNLQSMTVEAIEEYLSIAEYCVQTLKPNGGIYGMPALLLLLCVVDALTVNSGGREHSLEQIITVIPMTPNQLNKFRDWYRNLLTHHAVIAPGTMMSTVEGLPIEFNINGEPTYIRIIPFCRAIRELWFKFDKSKLNPKIRHERFPKTAMGTPSVQAPGITGCKS